MVAFLLYIIKSTYCLTLFYLGYKALLSNETFYRFNRGVLLAGMFLCMLLPLVQIRTATPGPLQQPLLQLEETIAEEMAGAVLPTTAIQLYPNGEEGRSGEKATGSIGWGNVFFYLYWGGMVAGVCRLALSFISLLVLIRGGRKVKQDGFLLILLGRDITPFNWGNYILLSEKDYREYPEEIVGHEQIHGRKRHTLDLVFAEAIILLHWFNPAVWLLKKELQEVHEFQADSGVLQSGIDATKYQLLLVKKAVSASSYTFANSFNHSKIKKRITMMLKDKSNSWARLKLLLLVPVAACTLAAFARPDMNRKLEQLVRNESTEISPADQSYTRDFFDREIERYMEQVGKAGLSDVEQFAYLSKHTNRIDFLINANDEIMYDTKYCTMDELPARLKSSLQKKSAIGKPVLFSFLRDAGTSDATVQKALELVGKAFVEYNALHTGKELPSLLFYGRPKVYGQKNITGKTPANTVVLKLFSEDKQTWIAYINPEDGREAICSKLSDLSAKHLSSVTISAPGDTPMGRIRDIKAALSDVYDMRNNKVEYK